MLGILIAVGIMIACIPIRMFADWLFERWVCKDCNCKGCCEKRNIEDK